MCKPHCYTIFLWLQAPVLLFTMVCVTVIAYTKPFQVAYVNVLEVFTHVTILLLFIIASTSRFKVCVLVTICSLHLQHIQDPVFKTESDIKESLVDHCGNVDSLSEHATMLVPFYYLPLLVFLNCINCEKDGRKNSNQIWQKISAQNNA